MTEQEIRDRKPDGATCYKLMKNGSPLYFDSNHNYWNWVSLKWVCTVVPYFDENIKPL